MREIEPELIGLAHHLKSGGDTFWTSDSLTSRESSTLFGMVHYVGPERRHRYEGPERRQAQLVLVRHE